MAGRSCHWFLIKQMGRKDARIPKFVKTNFKEILDNVDVDLVDDEVVPTVMLPGIKSDFSGSSKIKIEGLSGLKGKQFIYAWDGNRSMRKPMFKPGVKFHV